MGMTLFSKLSSAFKTRSHTSKKAGDSTGSDASKSAAQSEAVGALAHTSSQSKPSPVGRTKSLGTPKPVMHSGIKRAASLPAAKQVHRPHKAVLSNKNQPVDAAPILKPWPPTPSPVRKSSARKSKAAGIEKVTKLARVPKQAELRIKRRAHPYGVVRRRTGISGADLALQSEQKLINWVRRTAHHRHQTAVKARQIVANRAPTWADVATEHRTALLLTLELGIQRDTSSPRVAELWLDLLSRLDELGWSENHIGDDFMQALFALDAGKPSAASSAVAMAWVCAMEAEIWREDCGGDRNLVLENNPYFFAIQDKVNAYMDANHGASNAAFAEQAADCDGATFDALVAELQAAQQDATPAPVPDLNTEIDDLIAEFENMKGE